MSKLYALVALLFCATIFLSNNSTPPVGVTGAPGENTCATCHNPQNPNLDGMVTLTGMPAVITPNTAYVLTVTSTNPNGAAVKSGFELTILNSSNQQAGTVVPSNSTSTVVSSGGRQYWKHSGGALIYPASNMVTWTGTWTSPTMPPNTTITYYVACNVANGNGSSSGDLIVTSTGGGMLMGGGSNLTVSITSSINVLCNGQNTGSATALAMGGSTPYTYNWSNGGSGATINNLAAGTYTVTVTDNSSATATASVVITQPTLLVLTAPTITNVICNGGNNGSITAHASGGVSPYLFNWSTGANTATISNLTAGSFTVTVTDDNGCTKNATYQVTQPPVIVINLVNLTNESCAGANNGSITISVSGGVNPLFEEWSNGSTGTTISGLMPGSYSVTVTDNSDCTKSASFTINAGGTVSITTNQLQNVTCPGGSNGSISITATGGVSPYTYNWSNGATTSTISNLSAGTYAVTVTDNHGCTKVNGYMVTQPAAFVVLIMQTSQNLCFADSTADLTASVTGGTPPYSSLWSNGMSGVNNSNLHAGTYTITITDTNGCTSTKSATITDPPQLTVIVSTTDETSVGANNGTATATPAGGTPALSYLWSNGATTSMITGLPPGNYCVTITDMSGCSVTACGQVDAFGCSLNVMTSPDIAICEGVSVIVTTAISGASGNVTYLWTGGSTSDTLVVSQGGEYCVTVTDGAGCQDMDCISITEIILPGIDCPVINESTPGAHDGAVQCDSIPGAASYSWSTGATTSSITGLSAGIYCVTITYFNGCTKSQCFNVQPGNCQLTITFTQTNVACAGDTTGSIFVSANNVTAPVTYTWSNGETTSGINNLAAGNYDLTVADATGCFVTSTFIITDPLPIAITVDSIFPILDFDSGLIWITVNGGIPPYNYLWVDPAGGNFNTEDLNNLFRSGYYAVTVTDTAGCVAGLDSIFVDHFLAVKQTPKFKSLKIYPVPTEDVLNVDLENPINEVLISGIDGRLCKRFINPGSNQLNVQDIQPGWYFIRISDGHNWYIAQFVK